MNCDLAFDLMTDPAGCESQALLSHLAECPRCRQMQETLAPALDWLSDVRACDTDEPLPPSLAGYRSTGFVAHARATAEAVEIARESAVMLSPPTTPLAHRTIPFVGTIVRSAALLALGALIAIMFVPGTRPAGSTGEERDCLRRDAAAAAVRSTAEFEALAAMCANCHDKSGRLQPTDRRSGAARLRSFRDMGEMREAFQRLWPKLDSSDPSAKALVLSEAARDGELLLCFDGHRGHDCGTV